MIEKIIKKAISFLGVSEPTGDDQFIRYYNNITGAGFAMRSEERRVGTECRL